MGKGLGINTCYNSDERGTSLNRSMYSCPVPKLMVIVTCEHASNKIPPVYTSIISDKNVLKTHEGYDIGALSYAKILARSLSAPLFVSSFSRLLVDANRSPSNRHLFSRYTMRCSAAEKKTIVQKYYEPFRQKVFAAVDHELKQGHCVLHLSCHSFTPQLGRQIRTMDLGILYDPKRTGEVEFSIQLFERLQSSTSMRIRKNAPYRGNSDGHVAYLRRHFKPGRYLGIELEVNQALFVHTSPADIWKYVWLPALCREVLSICNGYQ